jgi:L-lactate permease
VPRYSDDLASAGGFITGVAALGMAGSVAGALYTGFEDGKYADIPIWTGTASIALGAVGVPLWIVGTAEDRDAMRRRSAGERRSTAMGVTGIAMSVVGLAGIGLSQYAGLAGGGEGDFAAIGAAVAGTTSAALSATLLGAGIALGVKGLGTVGERELDGYVPLIRAGPTSVSAAWAW